MLYCSSFLYRLLRGVPITSAVFEMFHAFSRSFCTRNARSAASLNSRSVPGEPVPAPTHRRRARTSVRPHGLGQVGDVDRLRRRHDDQPLDGVPQLADVPLPPVRAGAGPSRRGVKRLGLQVVVAAEQVREVPDQRRDVLGPLAQRRHVRSGSRSAGRRGPRGSVPFSISFSRSLLVAAMTRTSTLSVRADPTRSTSPSCSTRRTLACVLRLMSPISSRKIVPRSACSNLPICFSVAPVNEPLLVAEQLGLDQVVGNRRAVDLHEPLPAAQAVAVDQARHQLLADAALAADEHRRVRSAPRGAPPPAPAASRGSRRPSGGAPRPGAPELAVLVREAALVERVADGHEHALGRQRLLEEVERPALGRLDGRGDRPVPEIITTGVASAIALMPLEHLEAVHAGHLDVEEDEVGRLALDAARCPPAPPGRPAPRSPRTRGSSASTRGWRPRRQ